MKLNPNIYRRGLEGLRPRIALAVEHGQSLTRLASELSAATHIPVLAIIKFLLRADVVGENQGLLDNVGSLC